MIKRGIYLLLSLVLLVASSTVAYGVSDEECDKGSTDAGCIDYFNRKLADLGSQKKTLSSQIAQFNSQIQLTQLKISDSIATIDKLEKEIGALGARIGYVNQSVDKLESLLKKRILATYEQGFVSNLEIIVSSRDFSDLILRLQYLKQVQESDKKILTGLQQTKANYANQKDEREAKQAQIEASKKQLEALKASIDKQKIEKQAFLEQTKNDEARYQLLLSEAQAEQAVSFGGGTETYLRDVSQGDSIATIASMGVSAGCSSGPHLHFEAHKNGAVQDPNNYLKNTSYNYNYPDSYKTVYGSINPHGDLPWPINDPIGINQGFGAQKNSPQYGPAGHLGIDMQVGSGDATGQTVKTIKSGKLYGGSYNCPNGRLLYARVKHEDGLDTLYLHTVAH